jgi:hypothetical protein
MRLVIREYLSMLKESGELDTLLPDLLIEMGIIPLTRPGKGNRQDGVDIPAAGIDPEDGLQKLFLLTVKRGDITRDEWDKAPNGVRASLNEIIEGYLRTRVRPEHEALTKKIILVTGGGLKENVAQNWTNYVHEQTQIHPKYGKIEFAFWGGDELAPYIEKYLLDEYLFAESSRNNLRKTIALADQNEDEPRHYYKLIEEILFSSNFPKDKKKESVVKRQKVINLLNLSLNIVFYWCKEADNLRPSLLCAERSLLRTWDWMRKLDVLECKKTVEGFQNLFFTYIKIGRTYIVKLQPHCFVRDGFFGYGGDELEYPLRTFEVIGIIGSLGIAHCYCAYFSQSEEMKREYVDQTMAIKETIAALIENNPAGHSPRYDEHGIDIILGILGLLSLNSASHRNVVEDWVTRLGKVIIRGYQLGKYFPIASDSYEQLVALQFGQAPPKEKLMELSTILPMLADWYVILDLDTDYLSFQEAIAKVLTSTNLQYWFPDETTDDYIYACNAGYKSGITASSIKLSESIEQHKIMITNLLENYNEYKHLSCFNYGFPILAIISSRHFRTPVIPVFWQCYILAGKLSEDININE